MTTLIALAGAALAGPTLIPLPAQSLPKNTLAWGAGLGGGQQLQVSPGFSFSGWSRFGLTDRVEAFGGAWLSVPIGVGASGGLRVSAGTLAGQDGVAASAGILVGAGEWFHVALPLSVGVERRERRGWIGVQPAWFPQVEGAVAPVTVEGFPGDVVGHAGFEMPVEEDFDLSVTAGGSARATWFAMLGVTWSEW